MSGFVLNSFQTADDDTTTGVTLSLPQQVTARYWGEKNRWYTNCENKCPHPPAEAMQFGRMPVQLTIFVRESVRLQLV